VGKAEWVLLLVVVGALLGPLIALKAVSVFRHKGKLPPPQPYRDEED
jgi:hypothetical protein